MTGILVLDICIAIGIISGAVTLFWKAGAFVMGIYRRVQDFLDDWNGEPARPGVPARPGFPDRIAAIEADTAFTKTELKTNHGTSLRDAVNRMEKHLVDHMEIGSS